VEAVRQAINEGRFEVNAERIADRLISLERALNDAS
jgi:anti-sigma28 factor (negative regulator of flagellin synthesis)